MPAHKNYKMPFKKFTFALLFASIIFLSQSRPLIEDYPNWREKIVAMDFLFLRPDYSDEEAIGQLHSDAQNLSGRKVENFSSVGEALAAVIDSGKLAQFTQDDEYMKMEIDDIAKGLVEHFEYRCKKMEQSQKSLIDFKNIVTRLHELNRSAIIHQVKSQLNKSTFEVKQANWLSKFIRKMTEKLNRSLTPQCSKSSEDYLLAELNPKIQEFNNEMHRMSFLGGLIINPHFTFLEMIKLMVSATQDKSAEFDTHTSFYIQRIYMIVNLMFTLKMNEDTRSHFLSQYSYTASSLVTSLIFLEENFVSSRRFATLNELQHFYGRVIQQLMQIVIGHDNNKIEQAVKIQTGYFRPHVKYTLSPAFIDNMKQWYRGTYENKLSLENVQGSRQVEIHSLKIINFVNYLAFTNTILMKDNISFINAFEQLTTVNPAWYPILRKINLTFDQVGQGVFNSKPELFQAAMTSIFDMLGASQETDISAANLPKLWDQWLSSSENLTEQNRNYAMILRIVNFVLHVDEIRQLEFKSLSRQEIEIATSILSDPNSRSIARNLNVIIRAIKKSAPLTESKIQIPSDSTQILNSSKSQSSEFSAGEIIDWFASGNRIRLEQANPKRFGQLII